MSKPVLVLDVDGVVIRGRPGDGLPWYQTLDEDLGIDRAVLTERFFNAGFREALRGQADIVDLLRELFAELGIGITVDDFVDYWFRQDAGLNVELIEYVQDLRKRADVPCYLATNQENRRARYIWNTLGLERYFDGIVASADVGACKPEAAFFQRARERLGIGEGDRILFVDDREAFVAAAERNGWPARVFGGNRELFDAVEAWI